MKKLIALIAAFAIIAAPSAALAGKKKGPKPYKSETVHIVAGHPIFNSASESVVSVTAQEFIARCELPASNGLDGYVFEIPAAYQKINATIKAIGGNAAGVYDADIYTFNSNCEIVQAINAEGTDETGSMLKGTAFVFVHNYLPAPMDVHIELKPL